MSDGHEHDHEHDDAADAHDDHGFDGEPAKELGPEEPLTPMWVPGIGAAIFVLGAIFLLTRGDAEPAGPRGESTARPAATAAQTVATAMPQKPLGPMVQRPAATVPASGEALPRKLDQNQMKDLQRRIQEAQQRKQAADGAK